MARREVDLDALLARDALVLTLGGKRYELRDAAVETVIRLSETPEAERSDLGVILHAVLGPLGFTEEDERALGFRAKRAAAEQVMSFLLSTPEGLSGLPPASAGPSTGAASSPGSADATGATE